jgi:hypothetical protein
MTTLYLWTSPNPTPIDEDMEEEEDPHADNGKTEDQPEATSQKQDLRAPSHKKGQPSNASIVAKEDTTPEIAEVKRQGQPAL